MATRKEKCKRCKTKFLVPIDVLSASCPVCRHLLVTNNSNPALVPSAISNRNPSRVPSTINNRNPSRVPSIINNRNPARVPSAINDRNPARVPSAINDRIPHQALPNLNNQMQAYQGLQQTPAAPPVKGRKRAVLCGIMYKGHPKSLSGSINDVMCMQNFLINKLGFSKSKVRLLTEDEMDPSRIPTKKNIRNSLRWLVKECQPGDSLVFHYSGHGSKVRDNNGDEMDGHDESLCPLDYETEGRILDDEINETIVRPLPRGVTLHAIIDTCFSGTFLDLPYLCRMNRVGNFMWEDHRVRHTYKGSTGGTAISISACDDHQTSGDTTAFTGKANGALTYSFIKTLENKPKMTYGQLLITMRKEIHEAQVAVAGPNAHIQEPQLSGTSMFDIHSKNISI